LNLFRDQEVDGSNPFAPTTPFRINDIYHTRVTQKSKERLVENQAFLPDSGCARALFVL
jgi:hypothetical protein